MGSLSMQVAMATTVEQRAAIAISLPLKQRHAKLSDLAFWGRVIASNGRDYLLARASTQPPSSSSSSSPRGLPFFNKYYYSQDGVRWMDLQDISEDTYNLCQSIRGCFTGEPSHIYPIIVKVPPLESDLKPKDLEMQNETDDEQGNKETPGESKDELAQEDVVIRQDDDEDARNDSTNDAPEADEENKSTSRDDFKTLEIGELDRLTALMKQVDYECGVIPKGALVFDAKKNLVKNVYFPGVKFLQDLDSYVHLFQNYEESPLSNDVNGCWCIEMLPLEGVLLRSLWWPGYTFYYNATTKEFGSTYVGLGLKNIHLPFVL